MRTSCAISARNGSRRPGPTRRTTLPLWTSCKDWESCRPAAQQRGAAIRYCPAPPSAEVAARTEPAGQGAGHGVHTERVVTPEDGPALVPGRVEPAAQGPVVGAAASDARAEAHRLNQLA